jgi:hypothetical protein
MQSSPPRRLSILIHCAIITVAALAIATPASAQFGGLKKKLKKSTGQEATTTAAPAADPTPAQGGSVVLTADVVNQLIAGLKAGQAERERAAQSDDNSYGRYRKAERVYAEAQAKCESQRQAWAMKGNSKELDKANTLIEKSLQAQSKQDYKTAEIYQDSVNLLQGGPSCLVKKPEQPKDYYEAERESDVRVEQVAVKASGLSGGEYAMAQERAMAILRTGMPSDASQAEKKAVMDRKSELQPLLWPEEKPTVAAAKPAAQSAPAPASAAPQVDPQTQAMANQMGACMAKNIETHKSEVESLQKQAEAAQKAGDQSKLMAIAQRLQAIQMAGCMGR